MREVRASNDDGGNAPLVEEIPFCVEVSLVNACFNVGIFEQLPERVGIVEAEIRRCENAPLDSPLSQLREYFGEHLNSAGRDDATERSKLTQSRNSPLITESILLAGSLLLRMRGAKRSSGSFSDPMKLASRLFLKADFASSENSTTLYSMR